VQDVLLIGGGIIGLSLAWDLARHGRSVQVIDQGEIGREASWAGAGMLPPAKQSPGQHPTEQLRGLASELHPEWAAELTAATGIDTGYRRCGALHLAKTSGEAAALAAWANLSREEGITVERLSLSELAALEPNIATAGKAAPAAAYLLPDEAQLRNPRHLKALLAACTKLGVTITPHTAAIGFTTAGGELTEIETASGPLQARQYCFTAGAWTGALLQRNGIAAGILPIRGQMVLFGCEEPPLTRMVNVGSRYLVPRDDGHVLAGSTEEEVGFDKRNTAEAISDLTHFARGLVPLLHEARIEQTWAGLRPGSFDGLPFLGKLPGLANAFIAAGHFRLGLYLSPATALVMSQLLRGQQPKIDLAPFRVGR
jgi:glycine oxidase